MALSGRESSLVQIFCESCEQLDIIHPSVHMTWRFVIQGSRSYHNPQQLVKNLKCVFPEQIFLVVCIGQFCVDIKDVTFLW